jgi:S1-C subfamily serine protease
MATLEQPTGVLAAVSNELAAAVDTASRSVVAVHGRRRIPATGIVWRDGGIVVTADHVLEREEDITVSGPGDEKIGATIAGRDPGSDLAVLRLAESSPVAATLAPAGTLKVGNFVLALGASGGAGSGRVMASFGVVSALGLTWRTARGGVVEGYIRADVALYPGFSGGPLVDTQGQVVGVNSSHLARGQGIAIPANTVTATVDMLLTQGRVRRGYLGVTSQPVRLPSDLRGKLGLEQESGLLVLGVESGSPADKGGLIMGDVIISLGGQTIADPQDLQAALGPAVVGNATPAAVLRAGERKELSLTPSERS